MKFLVSTTSLIASTETQVASPILTLKDNPRRKLGFVDLLTPLTYENSG